MDKIYEDSETGCCPRFDPEPWDEKEVEWEEKLFLKERVRTLFHIPLNFGKVMIRSMEKIQAADALTPKPLMLSDHVSLWRMGVYVAVTKEVPGAEMATISGKFLSKVFEGPYKDAPKWCKEMSAFVQSRGKELKKMYYFYTTCPRCAKYYGKNYTVLLAGI